MPDNQISILALIPARGGSKSIPRKNLKLLAGHPLIAYSIAAGFQAACKPRVVVSTDDAEIAAAARVYGAEVPFLRPAELAQDETLDLPVFEHALAWFAEQEGWRPEIVIQLRPTSPFRPAGMIDAAVRILQDNAQATSVRGVVPAGQNPYKMWRVPAHGAMEPLLESDLPESYNQPRQKLPPSYWQTGHIDAVRAEVILAGSMSGAAIYPLHIEAQYAVDLDTLLDWDRAEWRLRDPQMEIVKPSITPSHSQAAKSPGDAPGASHGQSAKPSGNSPDTSSLAQPIGEADWQRTSHRPLPAQIDLLIFDFDGVFTDNTAWVDQHGVESVRVSRADGTGIDLLRKAGIEMMVLSTEPNPVVARRCEKLGLPYLHGIGQKGEALAKILAERRIDPGRAVYVGNDVNDLPCFPLAGCAVAVADAHPRVLAQADLVLSRRGGDGAVRELCDLILSRMESI